MLVDISNEKLQVKINSLGAELCSLACADSKMQYLWQADPAHWQRSSPILFPIVGGLVDSSYKVNGKEYSMSQHGFARNSEFVVETQTQTRCELSLSSNATTLENYPFEFKLTISYELCGQTLSVDWKVENPAKETLFFSIGAHPAINCPLDSSGSFEDYSLKFEASESASREYLVDGVRTCAEDFVVGADPLRLSRELFSNDALVLSGVNSRAITLLSEKTQRYVKVIFKGFPFLGLWSKSGADFVCIEPWHGVADSNKANGEICDKEGIIALEANGVFCSSYSIECG